MTEAASTIDARAAAEAQRAASAEEESNHTLLSVGSNDPVLACAWNPG